MLPSVCAWVPDGISHHCSGMCNDIIALMINEMCICVFLHFKSISVFIFDVLTVYRFVTKQLSWTKNSLVFSIILRVWKGPEIRKFKICPLAFLSKCIFNQDLTIFPLSLLCKPLTSLAWTFEKASSPVSWHWLLCLYCPQANQQTDLHKSDPVIHLLSLLRSSRLTQRRGLQVPVATLYLLIYLLSLSA